MKFYKKLIDGELNLIGTLEHLPDNVEEISEVEYLRLHKTFKENVVHVILDNEDEFSHLNSEEGGDSVE